MIFLSSVQYMEQTSHIICSVPVFNKACLVSVYYLVSKVSKIITCYEEVSLVTLPLAYGPELCEGQSG